MATDAAEIILGEVPLLRYAQPGSQELVSAVREGLRDPKVKAVLLRRHCIVSVGKNLEEAYRIATLIEDTAKIAFISQIIKTQRK